MRVIQTWFGQQSLDQEGRPHRRCGWVVPKTRSAPYLNWCASRQSIRSAPLGAIVGTTPTALKRGHPSCSRRGLCRPEALSNPSQVSSQFVLDSSASQEGISCLKNDTFVLRNPGNPHTVCSPMWEFVIWTRVTAPERRNNRAHISLRKQNLNEFPPSVC